jgi:hypothetical protein
MILYDRGALSRRCLVALYARVVIVKGQVQRTVRFDRKYALKECEAEGREVRGFELVGGCDK